jgi:DNA-directed RNA polymerase
MYRWRIYWKSHEMYAKKFNNYRIWLSIPIKSKKYRCLRYPRQKQNPKQFHAYAMDENKKYPYFTSNILQS